MKRKCKIIAIILLVIFIVCSFLIYQNWSLIKSVKNSFMYSQEELLEMKEKKDEETKDYLATAGISSIRPLTPEESAELSEGNISEKNAIDLVLGKKTIDEIKEDNNSKTDEPTNNQTENNENKDTNKNTNDKDTEKNNTSNKDAKEPTTTDIDAANERISELVGRMYVLKSQFEGELQGVESWTLSQYRSLTKEEKASSPLSGIKSRIRSQAINKCGALEKNCDALVAEVIAEITTLLKETNQDLTLVNVLQQSYQSEKEYIKSYYISAYN